VGQEPQSGNNNARKRFEGDNDNDDYEADDDYYHRLGDIVVKLFRDIPT
jgi:hypothetical protein